MKRIFLVLLLSSFIVVICGQTPLRTSQSDDGWTCINDSFISEYSFRHIHDEIFTSDSTAMINTNISSLSFQNDLYELLYWIKDFFGDSIFIDLLSKEIKHLRFDFGINSCGGELLAVRGLENDSLPTCLIDTILAFEKYFNNFTPPLPRRLEPYVDTTYVSSGLPINANNETMLLLPRSLAGVAYGYSLYLPYYAKRYRALMEAGYSGSDFLDDLNKYIQCPALDTYRKDTNLSLKCCDSIYVDSKYNELELYITLYKLYGTLWLRRLLDDNINLEFEFYTDDNGYPICGRMNGPEEKLRPKLLTDIMVYMRLRKIKFKKEGQSDKITLQFPGALPVDLNDLDNSIDMSTNMRLKIINKMYEVLKRHEFKVYDSPKTRFIWICG